MGQGAVAWQGSGAMVPTSGTDGKHQTIGRSEERAELPKDAPVLPRQSTAEDLGQSFAEAFGTSRTSGKKGLLPPPPEWDSPEGNMPILSSNSSPYSSATSQPELSPIPFSQMSSSSINGVLQGVDQARDIGRTTSTPAAEKGLKAMLERYSP